MLKREEIEAKYKWDLTDIYPDWESWEKDVERMKKLMEEIPAYKGEISKTPEKFIELTQKDEELSRLTDRVYLYPYLMKDLNSKDSKASEKLQEIESLYNQFQIVTSWITPEILTIPKETMVGWIDGNREALEAHRFSLMELYRLQAHVLDEKSEKLLSYFSQFNGSVNDIYSELSTSDIKWNRVKLLDKDGKESPEEIQVTNGVYSKVVSTDRNQENRKKVFEALYNSFKDNRNTYGAIYRGIVQRGVASARSKNFSTTLERALEPKNIPVEVYETLIKSTRENTDALHRYIDIRKKHLGLKEYHYYDNSINIVDYDREFSYDEAKNMVLESVKPLGEEYTEKLSRAISDGWLDVYETENKRSGAYSINIYDAHPYMLLNYNKTMDAVYTLAHELGHTLHSLYSSENQPYATSNYTIFVAEVASTFNERLLLDNMLAKTSKREERIALIEQALGNIVGTYYVQTMFADYEYQVHKMVEEGKPVTPDILDGIMVELMRVYFGEGIEIDELQKIIWARIPHFYNSPYYVYQYATSFAASAQLYRSVTGEEYSETQKAEARKRYLTLLKSGGDDHPMNQLKKAGADLSNPESFKAVAVEFHRLLDLLEEELKK
ncbi:MAG: oligoendopeptidase F [Fusobacteriaceae bacterium]